MSMQAAAGALNLLQVAGGAAILYAGSSSSTPTAGGWFSGGSCALEQHDLCTMLAALAVLTVLSWVFIKVTKVLLSCLCQPCAEGGMHREKVVEIVARCALAFGWLFLAVAVTISLNQADMQEQFVINDASHRPHPAADDSNSLIGHPPVRHVDHQEMLFYLLWIMAAMSVGLAVLAVASACCLACCCCCCNPDTLCAWAPCAAMCCFCCSEGGQCGDDCCCCSPLWCAEVLCLGWLVRKLWWQPDRHCDHTQHHCHYHDSPYHPPMPPPPPAQVLVHGGGGYYGTQAGLQEPLLASGPGGVPTYGGSSNTAWRSPQSSQAQPYSPGDPYYPPPIIHPAASMARQSGKGAKGDAEDFAPSAPPK